VHKKNGHNRNQAGDNQPEHELEVQPLHDILRNAVRSGFFVASVLDAFVKMPAAPRTKSTLAVNECGRSGRTPKSSTSERALEAPRLPPFNGPRSMFLLNDRSLTMSHASVRKTAVLEAQKNGVADFSTMATPQSWQLPL
jgi:hypothetical protein